MKNMINTIGKKIHTLVKENTPRRHKIRRDCGFSQKFTFSTDHCVFFPTVVRILVGRLDLCFLTHTKKYLTSIHALIFEKHVKMCVSIKGMKSRCNLITLLGKYTQQKRLAGRSFFQNSDLQLGLGCIVISYGRSSRAAPSSRFFMFF